MVGASAGIMMAEVLCISFGVVNYNKRGTISFNDGASNCNMDISTSVVVLSVIRI